MGCGASSAGGRAAAYAMATEKAAAPAAVAAPSPPTPPSPVSVPVNRASPRTGEPSAEPGAAECCSPGDSSDGQSTPSAVRRLSCSRRIARRSSLGALADEDGEIVFSDDEIEGWTAQHTVLVDEAGAQYCFGAPSPLDYPHGLVLWSPELIGHVSKDITTVTEVPEHATWPTHMYGQLSRHGMITRPAATSGDGTADAPSELVPKSNQDTACLVADAAGETPHARLLGVFDGHGNSGADVSAFVSEAFAGCLLAPDMIASLNDDEAASAIAQAALDVDARLAEDMPSEASSSGSTAVVAVCLQTKIHVATVGDSRCVLGQHATGGNSDGGGGESGYAGAGSASGLVASILSPLHAPDEPGEHERIVAAGGYVEPAGADRMLSPARSFFANGTAPGLSTSRSFGEQRARRIGITAEPEITTHARTEADGLLIVASDGVWNVLSPQEAVDIVSAARHATRGALALLQHAEARWAEKAIGYRDDMTVVVAVLDAALVDAP